MKIMTPQHWTNFCNILQNDVLPIVNSILQMQMAIFSAVLKLTDLSINFKENIIEI